MINTIASSQVVSNPRDSSSSNVSAKSSAALQMDDFLQLLTSQISNPRSVEPMKERIYFSNGQHCIP